MTDLFEYLLRLGDDALVAAQRLGEWSARAPEMEEDIALSNIALDQLGAARMFLTYAGEVEGAGRDEDALAYLRDDAEFRNAQLVELADDADRRRDFATAIAKLLCLSAYQYLLYERLRGSADDRIAAIAAKTREGIRVPPRSQFAVDGPARRRHPRVAPAHDGGGRGGLAVHVRAVRVRRRRGRGSSPTASRSTRPRCATSGSRSCTGCCARPSSRPPATTWRPTGGRHGRHTEALSYLLAEMQVLHRAHPGATW